MPPAHLASSDNFDESAHAAAAAEAAAIAAAAAAEAARQADLEQRRKLEVKHGRLFAQCAGFHLIIDADDGTRTASPKKVEAGSEIVLIKDPTTQRHEGVWVACETAKQSGAYTIRLIQADEDGKVLFLSRKADKVVLSHSPSVWRLYADGRIVARTSNDKAIQGPQYLDGAPADKERRLAMSTVFRKRLVPKTQVKVVALAVLVGRLLAQHVPPQIWMKLAEALVRGVASGVAGAVTKHLLEKYDREKPEIGDDAIWGVDDPGRSLPEGFEFA